MTHVDAGDTARVMFFPAEGRAEWRPEPMPEPGRGQILCRTLYSGISNGTERNHLTAGNYGRRFPAGIGYQKVARVEAVGPGVEQFSVGDTVFSGVVGKHADRFLENVAEPEGERNLVAHLPDNVDPVEAALLGVAGVAMHDVRRAGVGLGERVLVVGGGLIGQFTAQAALAAGAHVTLCNRGQQRLDIARELGIQDPFRIAGDESWQQLRDRGGFDAVFETSSGDVLDQIIGRTGGPAGGMLRRGGRLLIIGGRFDVTFDCNLAQFQALTLMFASHFRRPDLHTLLRLVGEGRIRVGPLLKDVVPIRDAERTYQRLYEDPASMLGTVFDWTDGASAAKG
ncbi:MAG: zinc-binding alcohol dehydrogenase [Phycisphaeraceae bacterium]